MLIIVVFPKAKDNGKTLFLNLLYSGLKENWDGLEENCFYYSESFKPKNAIHYIGFQTCSPTVHLLFLLFLFCC